MNKCKYCDNDLVIVDIDFEGFDVLGCEDCDFREDEKSMNDDMKYFL